MIDVYNFMNFSLYVVQDFDHLISLLGSYNFKPKGVQDFGSLRSVLDFVRLILTAIGVDTKPGKHNLYQKES